MSSISDKDGSPLLASRRTILRGAATLPFVGTANASTVSRRADHVSMLRDRTYAHVPLAKESVDFACIQNFAPPVDPTDPKTGIRNNLKRMVTLIDEHAHWTGPADLLSFHGAPISGHAAWTRQEMRSVSIELPGEEAEVMAAKAREYSLWLAFGCYVRDPDWPGHVLDLGVLMNPQGDIVAKHWKTHGSHLRPPSRELTATTACNVLPRYVEMYGRDEVMPVARTEVGNISITNAHCDPRVFQALALKGCEICIQQAAGSGPTGNALTSSKESGFYSSFVANAVSLSRRHGPVAASREGVTQVIDADGRSMAKAWGPFEEIVRTRLPIASYRAQRLLLERPMET